MEAVYLRDLMSSPVVFQYDGTRFIRMTMDRQAYEIKRLINDDLIQEEIVLYESLEDLRQRG